MKISAPSSFQHLIHVDRDLNWSFDPSVSAETLFRVDKQIGKGGFGSVYKLIHVPSQKVIAGKSINPDTLVGTAKESLLREIEILKTVLTPFTIQYYGNITYNNAPMILMEYCDRGSLRDLIDYRNAVLTEEQIAFVLYDLLQGVLILHKKYKILHRDIKAGNILLLSDGHIRVTDFGISRQFDDKKGESTISTIGTPYWMAPEVCQGMKYSYPADVWSIGCTAVELGEGAPPYCDLEPIQAMYAISTNGYPGFRDPAMFTKPFRNFVRMCCQTDPKKRPKIEELLGHEFIKSVQNYDRATVMGPLINTRINFDKLLQGEFDSESDSTSNVTTWISQARSTLHK